MGKFIRLKNVDGKNIVIFIDKIALIEDSSMGDSCHISSEFNDYGDGEPVYTSVAHPMAEVLKMIEESERVGK